MAQRDVDKKITTFSMRKSLLGELYGVYGGRGKINVNATGEELTCG